MREKQNVDGIHGSIRGSHCSNDHKCDLKPFDDTEGYTEKKPVCPRCGHLLRLVLAFFGKQCDLDAEWAAKMALKRLTSLSRWVHRAGCTLRTSTCAALGTSAPRQSTSISNRWRTGTTASTERSLGRQRKYC